MIRRSVLSQIKRAKRVAGCRLRVGVDGVDGVKGCDVCSGRLK